MDGLDKLREDLDIPDLTEGQALWLLTCMDATTLQMEAAGWRYYPGRPSVSVAEVARLQERSRGPVTQSLKCWRRRALEALGGDEQGGSK